MRSALVGIVLASAIAFGSPVRAADIAAGKEKAELCVGCHGESAAEEDRSWSSSALGPFAYAFLTSSAGGVITL